IVSAAAQATSRARSRAENLILHSRDVQVAHAASVAAGWTHVEVQFRARPCGHFSHSKELNRPQIEWPYALNASFTNANNHYTIPRYGDSPHRRPVDPSRSPRRERIATADLLGDPSSCPRRRRPARRPPAIVAGARRRSRRVPDHDVARVRAAHGGRLSRRPARLRHVRGARAPGRSAANQRPAPAPDEHEASAALAPRTSVDVDAARGPPPARTTARLQARRAGSGS